MAAGLVPLVEEAAGAAAGAGEIAGAAQAAGGAAKGMMGGGEKAASSGALRGFVPSGGGRGRSGRGGGGRRIRVNSNAEPDDTHNNDAPTFLERVWTADMMFDLFDRLRTTGIMEAGALPTYSEKVVVNVFGGKGSSLAGLYYLALSAAWGAIEPAPLFGAPIIVKTYVNRTARHVMAEISYSTKANLFTIASPGVNAATRQSALLNSSKIFLPPPAKVVGNSWNEKLSSMAFFENSVAVMQGALDLAGSPVAVAQAATLSDFKGRVITTPSDDFDSLKQTPFAKDYFELNPSPALDGLTRDSDLTAIITQALWDPEFQNPPPPQTNFRYKVGQSQNPYQGQTQAAAAGLINGEVAARAGIVLPAEVVAQIPADETNQNYPGRPMDPPSKTQ